MINHGLKKTCCEADGQPCCRSDCFQSSPELSRHPTYYNIIHLSLGNACRVDCLRLLRLLLHRLTEEDAKLPALTSYLAKTTLLHACSDRNQDNNWRTTELGRCFEQLVGDFAGDLERGELSDFFIPTQNGLSNIVSRKRRGWAHRLREQRDNGFPLFQ